MDRLETLYRSKPTLEAIVSDYDGTVMFSAEQCCQSAALQQPFPESWSSHCKKDEKSAAIVYIPKPGFKLDVEPVLQRIESGVPFLLYCSGLSKLDQFSLEWFQKVLQQVPPNLILLSRFELDLLIGEPPLHEVSSLAESAEESDLDIACRAAVAWHTAVCLFTDKGIFVSDGKSSVYSILPEKIKNFHHATYWLTFLGGLAMAVNSEQPLVSFPAGCSLLLGAALQAQNGQGPAAQRTEIMDIMYKNGTYAEFTLPEWSWQ